ncbi:MAG: putative transporter integral rane protein [Frankiales bacterium]|nr:putative transporter integral rane protein [Frankiales bacterium]
MIAAFRAEWERLAQRRLLFASAILVAAFAVGGAAIVLSAAKPARQSAPGSFVPTLESLSGSGGGTEIFRFAAAFGGTLTFVVFVGLFSLEYSRGTYRTMLLRQPRRVALLAGKLAGLLAFAAVVLAALEIAMWLAAQVEAPGFDVSTSQWTGANALGHALRDYLMVMLWVTGYAVFGMTVAILVRSVALALAVAVAWAGPLEHLIDDAWSPARRYFPGLLLEAVGVGGTGGVSATRAAVGAATYVVVFAAVTATVFSRRDITA